MRTHELVAVKVVKNKPAYLNQSLMEVAILQLVGLGSCVEMMALRLLFAPYPSSTKNTINTTNIIYFA
jgi:hypothetical protein